MSAVKYLQRFVNRNPRNMEHLRLQRKPDGWDLEKNRAIRNSIYRVEFQTSKGATIATVHHYEDGVVLEASTNEKTVKNQLHSSVDVSAAYNIGRLLALRCRMAGINSLVSGIAMDEEQEDTSQRKLSFLKALKENGIGFVEPDCIPHTHLNDPNLMTQPFAFQHTREDKLDEVDLSMELGKGVC